MKIQKNKCIDCLLMANFWACLFFSSHFKYFLVTVWCNMNKTEYHSVQTAGQNNDFKELYVALKNPKEP